jgi:hypothetical protein
MRVGLAFIPNRSCIVCISLICTRQDVRKLVAIDDAGWRQSRLRPVGSRSSKTASKFFAAQAIASWPSALKEASMADIDRVIASMQAERCIALEVAPLLDALFSWSVLDVGKLFKELLTAVQNTTGAAPAADDMSPALVEETQEEPVTVINKSLAQRLFALDVILNILHAMRTPSDTATRDLFTELQRVASENKKTCELLRTSLVQRTHQASFLAFESAAVCITSASDFAKLRDRSEMQRATAFDSAARQPVEGQQRELERVMELDHARLCCASKIEWRIVEGLGLLYLNRAVSIEHFLQGTRWLLAMLDETHRGIRATVRDALVRVTVSHATALTGMCLSNEAALANAAAASDGGDATAGASSPRHARDMHAWVMECISALLDQMTSPRLRLYRRKVDHIVIVAYLLRYCAAQPVRHAVVQHLLASWDASDGLVRAAAIDMIQFLGTVALPEVRKLLVNDRATPKAGASGNPLVSLITVKMQAGGPRAKDGKLQQLLQWALTAARANK